MQVAPEQPGRTTPLTLLEFQEARRYAVGRSVCSSFTLEVNWKDEHGRLHRDGDLPAILFYTGAQVWYRHGELHRDGGLPTHVLSDDGEPANALDVAPAPTKKSKSSDSMLSSSSQTQSLLEVLVDPREERGGFFTFHPPMLQGAMHALFESLLRKNQMFAQESITMWGNTIPIPRMVLHLGATYSYSGKQHVGIPFDADSGDDVVGMISRDLLPLVPHWARLGGFQETEDDWVPNECIVNWYCDGEKYIGRHSDDESCMNSSTVVMLTLGAERAWSLKSKNATNANSDAMKLRPKHGDVHVMTGALQKYFKHGMPKCADSSITPYNGVLDRISLTFRRMRVD